MGQQAKIRILAMHEAHLAEAGLTATLAAQPGCELVMPNVPAPRGSALLAWIADYGIDVVVTDFDRGLWLAQAIQRSPRPSGAVPARTIIVTGRTTQADIRNALKHGVGGYLMADCPLEEIVDAVRKVHMGMRHVSEQLARSLIDDMLGEQLTPREGEVLRLAAQGCANKVIAARLGVELGTVKCHMRAVMDKLRASNRTEAVVIASQRGLLALDRHAPDAGRDVPPTRSAWAPHANMTPVPELSATSA
jgi:two-component system NarL family response regulator